MTRIRAGVTWIVTKRLAFSILLLLILLAVTTSVSLAAPQSQDPTAGENAWADAGCKNCHGESGEGLWAGPLAGREKTAAEWIDQVRNPRRNMPRLSSEQISDQTITDMHAYVTGLPKPEGFSPQDADLPADAPEGQQLLVVKRCVACHSTSGPVSVFIRRGETPTVSAVIAQLRTPRQNMPSFSAAQVSDEEAALITEFLVAQIEPPALPTAGSQPLASVMPWALSGIGLLLLGLLWRRLARNT